MLTIMNDIELLTPVTDAAIEAGEMLLDGKGQRSFSDWTEFKDAYDGVEQPVTRLLRGRLGALRPAAGWADEFSPELGRGEYWLADAIDGAVQYLQGLPQWCVAITLVRGGAAVLTVLRNPVLGATYTAAAGGGAFRNGTPISPSGKTDVAICVMATSHPPFAARQPGVPDKAGRALAVMMPAVGAVRNLGPTSWQVADVASGHLDGFWQYGRDAGNLIGAALIGLGARGDVCPAYGEPWVPESDSFLAIPSGLRAQVLARLSLA